MGDDRARMFKIRCNPFRVDEGMSDVTLGKNEQQSRRFASRTARGLATLGWMLQSFQD